MQRLHETDVSGVILSTPMPYVHLCLPMEFEPEKLCTTVLGRADPRTVEGELLMPGNQSRMMVDILKKSLGSYGIAGQLQQRPAPREGGMFQRASFEPVGSAPPAAKRARAWDFAWSKPKHGGDPDYTAGVRMSRSEAGVFYIEHVARFRERTGEVETRVKNTAAQDTAETYIRIPQDPGAGKGVAERLGAALAGYMVTAKPVSGAKELRAQPFASQVDLGNVRLVRGDWNEDFLAELESFPNGAHDDQVDAASDAFLELTGIVPGEGLLTWYKQEAARVAAEAEPEVIDRGGFVGVIPPRGIWQAIGTAGNAYTADSDHVLWVTPDDAKRFLRDTDWRPHTAP